MSNCAKAQIQHATVELNPQVCFENMCLWLTQCLIAQTFSFLMLRLPEPQQENSLTRGAGK